MVDLLREADEALKQERVMRFWKENGRTVLAGMILAVLLTGALSAYRAWDRSVKSEQTDRTLALVDAEDFPRNIDSADLDLRPGLRGLVWLTAAGAHESKGKTTEARALYEKTVKDKAVPEDLRSLASLLGARLQTAEGQAESLQELNALATNSSDPWQAPAILETAALMAKEGDYAGALEKAESVRDTEGLPESLRGRAGALAQVYALRAYKAGQKENRE
ncbi:MAG: tetratricopeptide repeat protein [Alphaproteobacteria bacterium]|nr:tetratricopeptide repeat protein [Alphaproteobacteria bacterium]